MKKLRVGIIGCGRISVMHLSSAEALAQAELVACCDVKRDRADAAAAKYGIKPYYDYKEMLASEKLDAVHICLPHYLHVPVSVDAMKRGINVLSEKPMSITLEEAEAAVKCAEENKVNYGVIFQCRYNNSAQAVKKAVTSGSLGKILTAVSTLTWCRPKSYYADSDWKGTWDKEGGGVVIDQAIHSIDLVNWLVDSEPASVSCHMANRGHDFVAVEDCAEGLVTFANGVKYSFYCMNNYGADEPISIKLFCEKGKVEFNYDDAYIKYNDGKVAEVHPNDPLLNAVEGGKDYWGNQHAGQVSQFYNACLGLEPLEISGKNALKTQKLVCEIYRVGKPYIKA